MPEHALRYAYGDKPYQGQKSQRLRPRYRRTGRAERPYSGKVYVFVLPIEDYFDGRYYHVIDKFYHGEAKADIQIVQERESTVAGYIEEDRMCYQHIAKFPSFKGNWKPEYKEKSMV